MSGERQSPENDAPTLFDKYDGYYSVQLSGIEYARFAPSSIWSEYAKSMHHVTDFEYTFVSVRS